MYSSFAIFVAGVAIAAAENILINVGNGLPTFGPDSIQANVGDTVEFHFYSSLHTVVQGDFSTPCSMGSKKNSGWNSGPFNNTEDGGPNVFQVEIKDDKPIWFYCGTSTHCQEGMVGAVNAPTEGNTIDAYREAAASTDSSEQLPTVQGGCVVPVDTPPSSDCKNSGGVSSESSSAVATSSSTLPSSTVESQSSELSTSAAETTISEGSTAPTSVVESTTTSPGSSASHASTTGASPSSSVLPANVGSSLNVKTALVGGMVGGLGFLIMLL